MIATLINGFAATPWARAALHYGAITLTIVLFLLSIRRSGGVGACPPVVEYSRELQVRAAEELALLPDGSAVVDMLSDYAVMRDQARGCISN